MEEFERSTKNCLTKLFQHMEKYIVVLMGLISISRFVESNRNIMELRGRP